MPMPPVALNSPVGYRPRAASNPLKEIVTDHLEELLDVYDERFARTHGPMRRRVGEQFEAFLRCGDPHFGFLRLRCDACGEERFVPHSCKTRGLCPACGHKRATAWAERVVEEVLPDTRFVQLVFTIPRLLRKAFLFKRELYGELCRTAYASTLEFFRAHYPRLEDPRPALLAVPQSHGNLLNAHAHCHALCSLGVFDREAHFHPAPEDVDFSALEEIFREKTFQMLLKHEATTEERVAMLRTWKHSGFHVDSSRRAGPGEPAELEKVLQYMLRPPVSLRRLEYGPDGMVTYRGKYNPSLRRDHQHLPAVEFLALLVPHVELRLANAS